MPFTVQRLDRGIYVCSFRDNPSVEDFYNARDEVTRQAQSDQVLRHVAIIDGNFGKNLPLDVRALRRAIPEDRLLTMAINAAPIGRLLARIFSQTTGISIMRCPAHALR